MGWRMVPTRWKTRKRKLSNREDHIELVWVMTRYQRARHLGECGTSCPWYQNYLMHHK